MKNSTTELENGQDGTFPQYFSDNGPRLVASGLIRTSLTHRPLTAIVNVNKNLNDPFSYKVGLVFYVPDGSPVPKIEFNIIPKNPALLQAIITYDDIAHEDNNSYTLYDFHHKFYTGVVQLDGLDVFINPLKEGNDDYKDDRGTHVIVQYSN